jgi:hypothetical protein
MLRQELNNEALKQPSSLARLQLSKACRAGHRIALLVHAHSRVGRVRWCPSLRHVDTWMPPPVQLTTPMSTYKQTQLTCYRAEPSPPFLSPGAARVASTQCMTKIGGHPLRLVRTSVVSTFGKPSPPCAPLFPATSSVLSHLSPRMQVPELHQSP